MFRSGELDKIVEEALNPEANLLLGISSYRGMSYLMEKFFDLEQMNPNFSEQYKNFMDEEENYPCCLVRKFIVDNYGVIRDHQNQICCFPYIYMRVFKFL